MKAGSSKFKTVSEYISTFPPTTQRLLKALRKTVKEAVPDGKEVISYNMPAIKMHGVLVYYAGYKNHIGFYPTGSGVAAFEKELATYEGSTGTVRFSIDQPLPLSLIRKIVTFRLKQDREKEKLKREKLKK